MPDKLALLLEFLDTVSMTVIATAVYQSATTERIRTKLDSLYW